SWNAPSGDSRQSSARSWSCATTSGWNRPRSPRRSASRRGPPDPDSTTPIARCARPRGRCASCRGWRAIGMNDPIAIELVLDDWFADGSDVMPDRSIDALLATVGRTKQRGAWRTPWRIPALHGLPRLAAIAGATIVVALAAAGFFALAGG